MKSLLRSVELQPVPGLKESTIAKESLKVLSVSLKETRVVLIRWLIAGQRLEETVPTNRARHRRNELEAQGAVVYWSERLAESH